jgi:V8-like Glu-specific endopeptidase
MAKSRDATLKTRRGTAPKSATRAARSALRRGNPSWAAVALRDHASDGGHLLDVGQKKDSLDAGRMLVREGQFADSFMMGTNGGATFEELLRPRIAGAGGTAAAVGAAGPDRRLAAYPASPKDARRRSLHNVLGGTDDRVRIVDTSHIPARSIGLLRIRPEDGEERFGTAWLIGPRTLATAAHNLLHPEAGPTQSLSVGLAFDGSAARGGWHKIVDNKFSEAWRDDPSPDNPNDFAVIRIDDAQVGNKLGWFGYANYEDAKFDDLAVNIFGYPLDVDAPLGMYGSKGRVVSLGERRLFYDCDAGGGMSGGPVVALFGEKRIAVGIHVAGGTSSNVATRITGAAFDLFERHKSW